MTTMHLLRNRLAPCGNALLAMSLFTVFISFWTAVPCFAAGLLLHALDHAVEATPTADTLSDDDAAFLFV